MFLKVNNSMHTSVTTGSNAGYVSHVAKTKQPLRLVLGTAESKTPTDDTDGNFMKDAFDAGTRNGGYDPCCPKNSAGFDLLI